MDEQRATPDPPKLADTKGGFCFYHVPFCWEIGCKGNMLSLLMSGLNPDEMDED